MSVEKIRTFVIISKQKLDWKNTGSKIRAQRWSHTYATSSSGEELRTDWTASAQ